MLARVGAGCGLRASCSPGAWCRRRWPSCRRHDLLRAALPARRGRGGLLPRHHLLPHAVVPGPRARPGRGAVHDRTAIAGVIGGAAVERAAAARRHVGTARAGSGCSWSKACPRSCSRRSCWRRLDRAARATPPGSRAPSGDWLAWRRSPPSRRNRGRTHGTFAAAVRAAGACGRWRPSTSRSCWPSTASASGCRRSCNRRARLSSATVALAFGDSLRRGDGGDGDHRHAIGSDRRTALARRGPSLIGATGFIFTILLPPTSTNALITPVDRGVWHLGHARSALDVADLVPARHGGRGRHRTREFDRQRRRFCGTRLDGLDARSDGRILGGFPDVGGVSGGGGRHCCADAIAEVKNGPDPFFLSALRPTGFNAANRGERRPGSFSPLNTVSSARRGRV